MRRKCKFCKSEVWDYDFLFCPYCGKPLYKDEIKEHERPNENDLKFLITDKSGLKIVGGVFSNKRCIEIHLMGKKSTVVQIDLQTLDVDLFQEDKKRTEEMIAWSTK